MRIAALDLTRKSEVLFFRRFCNIIPLGDYKTGRFCYAQYGKERSKDRPGEAFALRVPKKRFLYSAIGAVLCATAAIFFASVSAWHAAVLFAVGTVVATIFAFRFLENYRAARLITENPILQVGIASVAEAGAGETAGASVNVVVSGFGILMDEKPYKFGHGGVDLTETMIDRERITLSFGDKEKAYSVRLLHGIAEKAEVDKLTERLRYETGVVADVHGW